MTKEQYKTFEKELNSFTSHIEKLHQNNNLAKEDTYLKNIASSINSLYQKSKELIDSTVAEEEIQETSSIIQGIFTQVLSTNETMMSATESFTQDKQTEKLSAIMQEYAKHPAATKVFLMELKYLSLEIEEHLKKAS